MITQLFLFSILSLAYSDTIIVAPDHNTYRALTTYIDPVTGSYCLGGLSYTCDQAGNKESGSADLNGLAYKWDRYGCAMGVVAFGATASYNYVPSSSGGNGTVITSFAAAFAELLWSWNWIFAWVEKNDTPGFQYNLGDECWTGNTANQDFIYPGSGINPKQYPDGDLNWSTISSFTTPCGVDYPPNCYMYTLTSIGSTLLGTNVLKIVVKCTNQDIIVVDATTGEEHPIGPDSCKVSFTITYPYTEKGLTLQKSQLNVGVALVLAGKAGAAGIVAATDIKTGKSAVVFGAAGSEQSAFFSWDKQAQLDGVNKDVFLNTISGGEIIKYDTTNADIISKVVIGLWQLGCGLAALQGWTTQLVLLSFPQPGCNSVYYDPTAGMAANSDFTSSAGFMAPTLLSFFWVVMLFLYHRR